MKLIRHINEGLVLIQDPTDHNKTLVRITDLHQEGLDISLDTNPVCYDFPVHINLYNKDIKFKVISIFKRKTFKTKYKDVDGNPALYALKNENNYKFFSDEDKDLLMKRFKVILSGIFKNIDGTVIVPNRKSAVTNMHTGIALPSSNELNSIIQNAIYETNPNINFISDIIRKLDTEHVYNACCMPNSKFRTYWYNKGLDVYEITDLQDELAGVLDDKMPDNIFKRHKLPSKFRKSVLTTLELSYNSIYKKHINGKDILLFDDTLTYGHTLEETINLIYDSYEPKSITILTLFSKKFNN